MKGTLMTRWFGLATFVLMICACSHKYDSNTLDLGFYQWNMWPDAEAVAMVEDYGEGQIPTCGWEVLHRGIGKLVRIPAVPEEHLGQDEVSEVTWFHCRFTLPEAWEGRRIGLHFGGAGPQAEVFLNEQLVGSHTGSNQPFEIDLTEVIYYTRDNHLAVRVCDPEKESGGITGTILVRSVPLPIEQQVSREDR